MMITEGAGGRFVHQALFYRGADEFVATTATVVYASLDEGAPVLVALPTKNLQRLRQFLNGAAQRVRWVDMRLAGRNPGRILPSVMTAFADEHADRRVVVIGEPIWAGRGRGEYAAAFQHEALVNLAFAGRAATIVCPYDLSSLNPEAVRDAARTHPEILEGGASRTSASYTDPAVLAAEVAVAALQAAPIGARELTVSDASGLREARTLLQTQGAEAGLAGHRLASFALAGHEALVNALAHSVGAATLSVWSESDALVCEVRSRSQISDPLVGRLAAGEDASTGRGLLVINTLCDLVQLASSASGTTIRMSTMLRETGSDAPHQTGPEQLSRTRGSAMFTARRARILSLLAEHDDGESVTTRICALSVRLAGVSGAGLTVIGEDDQRGLMCATDNTARAVDAVQLTLGEGPGIDAFAARHPVLTPDLAAAGASWPEFASHRETAGVAAIFCFPLQIGAARLGTLDLYRTTPGALASDELADALVCADLATQALLTSTGGGTVELNSLDGVDSHPQVFQATGMIMVQLGVTAANALLRLRAHAYATEQLVTDVAHEVVERRLLLDKDTA